MKQVNFKNYGRYSSDNYIDGGNKVARLNDEDLNTKYNKCFNNKEEQ